VSVRVDEPGLFYQSVFVTNGCPTTQRVKVLWAFATDSACHSISPGTTYAASTASSRVERHQSTL